MDDIRVSEMAVNYMEKKDLYNRPVATHFLMSVNLTNPVPGYLSSKRIFTNVQPALDESSEYAILSSFEEVPQINVKVEQLHPQLLITFHQKQSWCRIYRIK